MGHLLRTVNPEAADAIQPDDDHFPVREPYIGEMVQYHARPGEGRAGKMVFPAIVHHWDSEGRCQLTVLYAADDLRDYVNVQKKNHDRPWNAWDFTPTSLEAAAGLKMLYDIVCGDRVNDGVSILEKLQAIDERVKVLEAIQERIAEARRKGLLTQRANKAGAEIAREAATDNSQTIPVDEAKAD